MSCPVFVGSAFVAQYPTGGGNFWVPLQYLLGLRALGVGGHDVYLTIGQNLGAPDSPVSVDDVAWQRVWPAVHLPAWPDRPAEAGGRYTTVTQWWTNQYAFLDGETYDCNKRPGFLEVLDLPSRVHAPLELAANLHPAETEDRTLLARHGWRLADPEQVAGTPEAFRRYVQT